MLLWSLSYRRAELPRLLASGSDDPFQHAFSHGRQTTEVKSHGGYHTIQCFPTILSRLPTSSWILQWWRSPTPALPGLSHKCSEKLTCALTYGCWIWVTWLIKQHRYFLKKNKHDLSHTVPLRCMGKTYTPCFILVGIWIGKKGTLHMVRRRAESGGAWIGLLTTLRGNSSKVNRLTA